MNATLGTRQTLQSRPPFDDRRHSTGYISRNRGPLRSSPLAGPVMSPNGPIFDQESSPSPVARPRPRPSRISSGPDLPALSAAIVMNSALPVPTTTSHSRSAESSSFDGVHTLPTRPTRPKSAHGTTSSMPTMPAWARDSLSQSSADASPTSISHASKPADWLTHAPAPIFSRAGLGAGAVVMPVRAPRSHRSNVSRSASIRSVNSVASSSRSISSVDALEMSSRRGRSRSATDTRSTFSLSSRKSVTISLQSPPKSPNEDSEPLAERPLPDLPAAVPEAPKVPQTRVKRRTFSFSSMVSLKSSKNQSVAASLVSSGSTVPVTSVMFATPAMPAVAVTASREYHTVRCLGQGRDIAVPRNISGSSLHALTEPTIALSPLAVPCSDSDCISSSSPDMPYSGGFASSDSTTNIIIGLHGLNTPSSLGSPNMTHSPIPSLSRTSTYGSSLATTASMYNYGTVVPLPSPSMSPLSSPRSDFKLESGHVWSSSVDDVRGRRDDRGVRVDEFGMSGMSSKGERGENGKKKHLSLWGKLKRVTMSKRAKPM